MIPRILFTAAVSLLLFSCKPNAQPANNEPATPPKSRVVRETNSSTVLNPEVQLDRTHLLTGKDEEVFLMVKFDIPEQEEARKNRPDLSLSMVLDRSGSMSGEGKMTYVKEAASKGVDLLKESDQIAIVEYDTEITPLWPLAPVLYKEMIHSAIGTLHPRGGTNLCGGMDEGIAQLSRDTSGSLKRVLLLSDGLANSGITHPEQIAMHAKNAYKNGITVSTMGVGLDYNEDLLQAIAEAGGGNYFFIEDPASVRDIFAQEMSSLFHTVAQNINLSVEGSSSIQSCAIVGDSGTVKKISSLYGGEKRVVLFKLKIRADKRGEVDLGTVQIRYAIPETENVETVQFKLAMTATGDSAKVTQSVIKPVRAEATLIEAEEIHEESVKLYEAGRKDEALRQIKQTNTQLKALNVQLKDQRISSKIQAFEMENQEMEQADQSVQQRKLYLKRSKERSYYAKEGKRGKFVVGTSSDKVSVVKIQKKLQVEGYYKGTVDGIYSQEVKAAVAEFQRAQGLDVDSIAGPMTLKKMGMY